MPLSNVEESNLLVVVATEVETVLGQRVVSRGCIPGSWMLRCDRPVFIDTAISTPSLQSILKSVR